MEKAKKNLKIASWLVLVMVAFSAVRMIVDAALKGFEVKEVPEGMTEDIVRIALIVAFALGFVVLLPQIYVGIKGLKVANAPCLAKGHIVWATILLVIALLSLISPISAIFSAEKVSSHLAELSNALVNVAVYALFLSSALEVKKAL